MSDAAGVVLVVSVVPLGDELVVDAAAGDLALAVADTADFSEDGGTVRIGGDGGEVVDYVSCDDDAGTFVLATPLVGAWVAGQRVDLFDRTANAAGVESRALIQLPGEDANDDSLDAVITHALVPLLPEGVREPDDGESVRVTQIGMEWVVTEIVGRAPTIAGEMIAPGSISRESIGFQVGGTTVTVGVAPSDPATGDVWFDIDNGYAMNLWNGSAWALSQFGTSAIVASAITADLIAANAVGAGKVVAGSISAKELSVDALNAQSITSVTMQGNMIDGTIRSTDFLVDADDGRVLIYSQTGAVLLVNDSTPGTTKSVTVPAGVTYVKVEAWGSGGSGAGDGYAPPGDPAGTASGGGGGGAEYACEPSFAVKAGDTINYVVASGAVGGTSKRNGNAGASSTVGLNGGAAFLTAHGGSGGKTNNTAGTGRAGGAGGTTSTNTAHFNGGTGGAPANHDLGGGGGAGAGTVSLGASGSTTTTAGGVGFNGGGSGSAGGTYGLSATTAGVVPGGGGGGGGSFNTVGTSGAAGGAGRVRVTYYTTALVGSIACKAGVDPLTGATYPAGIHDTLTSVVQTLACSAPLNAAGPGGAYPGSTLYYAKDSNDLVTFWGWGWVATALTAGTTYSVGSLPAGYFPPYNLSFPAVAFVAGQPAGRVQVYNNGVVAYVPTAATPVGAGCSLTGSFKIA
jgi:hypothetical protein